MERAFNNIGVHVEKIARPGGDGYEVSLAIGLVTEVSTELGQEIEAMLAGDLEGEAAERLLAMSLAWATARISPYVMAMRWGKRPQRVAPGRN